MCAPLLLAAALAAAPAWVPTHLAGPVHQLTADGGGYPVKVLASVGPDGILLVDTGPQELRDGLKAALAALAPGVPRIVVLTHAHSEHVGGTTVFGPGPLVLGHAALRARMSSGPYLFDDLPEGALPRLTFTEEIRLRFNGEEIRIVPFPGAHDDSDVVVWFTGSKVAAVGGVCNGRHFPSVDGETGDVTRYPEVVAGLLALLPPDVTIVPGHGENGTIEDARSFHRMLLDTTAAVRAGLAAGKDVEAMEKEDLLAPWKGFEIPYADRGYWLRTLARGYGGPRESRPRPYEPLYRALKEGGMPAVRARYARIKETEPDAWRLDDKGLYIMAYGLNDRGLRADARGFLELSLQEYPDGPYAWACHAMLGDIARTEGDRDAARASWRKALELHPGDAQLMAKLEAVGR